MRKSKRIKLKPMIVFTLSLTHKPERKLRGLHWDGKPRFTSRVEQALLFRTAVEADTYLAEFTASQGGSLPVEQDMFVRKQTIYYMKKELKA